MPAPSSDKPRLATLDRLVERDPISTRPAADTRSSAARCWRLHGAEPVPGVATAVNLEPAPGQPPTWISPPMARAKPSARDGEPKTCAALMPAHGRFRLLELEEQAGQRFLAECRCPYPRPYGRRALRPDTGCAAGAIRSAAAGHEQYRRIVGELDGVAHQVGEDLAQAHLVAYAAGCGSLRIRPPRRAYRYPFFEAPSAPAAPHALHAFV